ncbi:MAG: Asp-tRNA(Asn)/Glu-tRNA(Gln) amidotransferase subunit GatC [Acidimicrobiia bacterium]|nr:Asp-tRNA(Asn)/Glu-tRNA(Gln) amidotransferase subunit GatC [Acidimicrobiia bacterium]
MSSHHETPGASPPRAHLTTDDVAKVAKLALLELSDAELATFTGQLDAVLDLAEQLNEFDIGDVPPTAHPFGLVNVFRDDVAAIGHDAEVMREEALAAGPEVEAHQFKVPPALGEAP